MSLVEAIIATGPIPEPSVSQSEKKRYSEILSDKLARQVASGLREVGFSNVQPTSDGKSEKTFQGGLGPKRVDVSFSDDQNGLLLAVSIKSINFPKYGKNLKNRFGDLLTEAITLHLRFPFSVVCMLFAFPLGANSDLGPLGRLTTFERARRLFATVSGRKDYTDPGEKFENVTLLLFEPFDGQNVAPAIQLIDAQTKQAITEEEYFQKIRELYNIRNPHSVIGEDDLEDLS